MRFLLRRLFLALLMTLLTLTITFILMNLVPGNPFSDEKGLSPEIKKSLDAHFGLDRPLIYQYFSYIYSFATWDFGPSMQYPDVQIKDIIRNNFPVSFMLGMEVLFFSIAIGVFLGSLASYYRGGALEAQVFYMTMAFISVPSFCVGVLLQYVFSVKLGWMPIAHLDNFWQSILPTLSLSIFPIAYITTLTKEKTIETLKKTYVKTAFAKGLHPIVVMGKHVLPGSFFPLIGYLGQLTANILVGSFVIEKIFAIPGLGGFFVQSVFARDYTVIMNLTAFYALILSVCIFLSEIFSIWLNPFEKQCLKDDSFYEKL